MQQPALLLRFKVRGGGKEGSAVGHVADDGLPVGADGGQRTGLVQMWGLRASYGTTRDDTSDDLKKKKKEESQSKMGSVAAGQVILQGG